MYKEIACIAYRTIVSLFTIVGSGSADHVFCARCSVHQSDCRHHRYDELYLQNCFLTEKMFYRMTYDLVWYMYLTNE